MDSPSYTTLLLDLGDVLLHWSAHTQVISIPARTLKAILSSFVWHRYESGKIGQEECYSLLGEEFSLLPSDIETALARARESLRPNEPLVTLIRELKRMYPGLRTYAMSNISAPDYEYIRRERSETDWSIFDGVYTSAAAGTRKPNLDFFELVLCDINVDPRTVIFIDDKPENVLAARSKSIHGIIFDDDVNLLERSLHNLLGNPIERGENFLRKRAGNLETTTDGGIVIEENFTQLLIYEATGDESLARLPDVKSSSEWQFNYFSGTPQLTTAEFPNDLDTTSLTLSIMPARQDQISNALNNMLEALTQFINEDGIIQTYFDHKRARVDPVVCVNVLTFFYSNGQGEALSRTLAWVHDVLVHRAYADGTRYYDTPECFLFFVGRLLALAPSAYDLHATLRSLLIQRTLERLGVPGDALALAMRVIICARLGGVVADRDLATLRALQCADGGWPISYIYRMGSSGVRIGSRGLTTAFVLNAIRAVRELPTPVSPPFSVPVWLPPQAHQEDAKTIGTSRTRSHRRASSIGDASRRFLQRLWRRSGVSEANSVVKVI